MVVLQVRVSPQGSRAVTVYLNVVLEPCRHRGRSSGVGWPPGGRNRATESPVAPQPRKPNAGIWAINRKWQLSVPLIRKPNESNHASLAEVKIHGGSVCGKNPWWQYRW
jgi:hypothetical protein